ncbi:MAG TPA: GPR1/FUN34/YaaH family transporter [Verrucomicrobiae bacterium]|nr:GPR1/FUN34/YaaH family transporter [Bryobacteraceae bacterium]HXU20147.1 GPR1/FUN34/YaaH family transporter [Verrucomicrobiae bacterium]
MPYESMQQPVAPDTPHRIYLQPIAAPSILGLYALAGGVFVVSTNMAHWYGSSETMLLLIPFVVFFGGLAQFLAGMWAYKARDGLATVLHGMWGSFFMGYSLLYLVFEFGRTAVPVPTTALFPDIGVCFIVLAAITWVIAGAAAAESRSLTSTMVLLAAGATLAAIGLLAGADALTVIAGWVLFVSSLFAWYTASALLLEDACGREIWGLGKSKRMKEAPQVMTGIGEPGVIHGQA